MVAIGSETNIFVAREKVLLRNYVVYVKDQ